jgi:hypothetical protein
MSARLRDGKPMAEHACPKLAELPQEEVPPEERVHHVWLLARLYA